MIYQKEITISAKSKGFHIITNEVIKQIPEIAEVKMGTINLFIKHTSASLTLNPLTLNPLN